MEGIRNDWGFHNGLPPSEMDLLGMVSKQNKDMFNLLPNLPYNSNIIFDPLTYGQYLDGTEAFPKKFYSGKYLNRNDVVAVEIYAKRISFKFAKNKPSVKWNNKTYYLANLKVKSKRLDRFLPSNYKKYT